MHVNFDQSYIRLVDDSDVIGTVPWSREFPLLARLIRGTRIKAQSQRNCPGLLGTLSFVPLLGFHQNPHGCSWADEREEGHEEAAVQPLWESGDPL